jgi:HEAT repeat protein
MMSFTTDPEPTANPPVDVAEVLHESATGQINSGRVSELSDPSREQLQAFRSVWPDLSVKVRRELVREMMRQSDENLALDFSRYFRAAMRDDDDEVRARAIRALWEDDTLSFLHEVCALALTEESAAVQEAVAIGLGTFSYQVEMEELGEDSAARTQEALFRLIEHGRTWMVRRRALESAAYMSRNQRVKELIDDAYRSDFEQECAGALIAMGRNLDPLWSPIIIRELRNDDPDIRCEAARAAGEFGTADAIDELARLTADEDEEIRTVSVQSIGQIGGRKAIDTLRYLETQVDEELKPVVRQALDEAEFLAETTGLEG